MQFLEKNSSYIMMHAQCHCSPHKIPCYLLVLSSVILIITHYSSWLLWMSLYYTVVVEIMINVLMVLIVAVVY